MFKRKSKDEKEVIFQYFEDNNVIWNILIEVLNKEGWLSKKEFSPGDSNLFKSGSKTFKTKIKEFDLNKKIELILERANIGNQVFQFLMEKNKKRTIMSMKTILNLLDSSNNKKIILSFQKNAKQLDVRMRDELERRGLKAYF